MARRDFFLGSRHVIFNCENTHTTYKEFLNYLPLFPCSVLDKILSFVMQKCNNLLFWIMSHNIKPLNLYLQWIAHLVMSTCTRKCMLLGSISAYFWTYGKTYYVFLDIRKDICTQSWTYGKTLFWTYGKTDFLILKNMFLLMKKIFYATF